MKPIIAYIRVSTQKQGRSGLGLEAQREQLSRFAAAEAMSIVAEFIEVETGKGADALAKRPQLAAALTKARELGCPIAVAKLDRLSRDVHFISGLMTHRIPFVVADLGPAVDPFILHLFAALAEKERSMISKRTREALARAKQRGVRLGNPVQAAANAAAAKARAEQLRSILAPMAHLSACETAKILNSRYIPTPTGAPWSAKTIIRVRKRIAS